MTKKILAKRRTTFAYLAGKTWQTNIGIPFLVIHLTHICVNKCMSSQKDINIIRYWLKYICLSSSYTQIIKLCILEVQGTNYLESIQVHRMISLRNRFMTSVHTEWSAWNSCYRDMRIKDNTYSTPTCLNLEILNETLSSFQICLKIFEGVLKMI